MTRVVAARLDDDTARQASALAERRGVGMSRLVAGAVVRELVDAGELDEQTGAARLRARDTRAAR